MHSAQPIGYDHRTSCLIGRDELPHVQLLDINYLDTLDLGKYYHQLIGSVVLDLFVCVNVCVCVCVCVCVYVFVCVCVCVCECV